MEKYGNSFFWGNKGIPIGFPINQKKICFSANTLKARFAAFRPPAEVSRGRGGRG
jgi:hypothetical protein